MQPWPLGKQRRFAVFHKYFYKSKNAKTSIKIILDVLKQIS
jgi:hypothetical protein